MGGSSGRGGGGGGGSRGHRWGNKKNKRNNVPALPKSGELSDYWSTLALPHGGDSSDEESEQDREKARNNSSNSDGRVPPATMAVERLQWETLRTEMTIAEINAERGFALIVENPELDDSSSSDDERKSIPSSSPSIQNATSKSETTQEELDFYSSLIAPIVEGVVPVKTDRPSAVVVTGPPSPLVRAMMPGYSDDEDEVNDERWLAIDQSGDYMKEYERELRKTLQEEVGGNSGRSDLH